MKLGYPHPDHWLATVTSRQVADWMAFGMLEQVGEVVPPDKEELEARQRQAQRAKVEGGLRALKQRQDHGNR